MPSLESSPLASNWPSHTPRFPRRRKKNSCMDPWCWKKCKGNGEKDSNFEFRLFLLFYRSFFPGKCKVSSFNLFPPFFVLKTAPIPAHNGFPFYSGFFCRFLRPKTNSLDGGLCEQFRNSKLAKPETTFFVCPSAAVEDNHTPPPPTVSPPNVNWSNYALLRIVPFFAELVF